jgi:uncharacterized protein (TIGR02145 family)
MKLQKYLANDDGGIDLSVLNPAGKPEIYTHVAPVTLSVKLTNFTASTILLESGAVASTFRVFFPSFFTKDDIGNMKISVKDWTFTNEGKKDGLVLKYSGTTAGSWNYGDDIDFDITGVATSAQPNSGSVQVNFENFGVGMVDQQTTPFSVTNEPVKGNPDLAKVLQVSLDSQGEVFVSPTKDPIRNSIFLNIKNIGDDKIYTDQEMWKEAPTISVVFVYGRSSGSLAFDDLDKKTETGSAWNIEANIPYGPPDYLWDTENPKDKENLEHPVWILKPNKLNQGILGTGKDSNITFAFDKIISFTPPGHTQMLITFNGFRKDKKTPYNNPVYVLDIVKQYAPPTRGMVNFFSSTPVITVAEANKSITVPLRWAMFEVPRIKILTSYEGVLAYDKPYNDSPIVNYDSKDIVIPGVTQSSSVIFTAQAYNNNDGYLNSMQFTVFIQATMFFDPRDGKTYPIVRVGNRLWVAANIDYDSDDSRLNGPEDEYGRLYTYKDALPTGIHSGWRLPNKDDWEDLIKRQNYDQLIKGGTSGFNAVLNGWRDDHGSESGFDESGTYWSSKHDGAGLNYVKFSKVSKSVFYVDGSDSIPPDFYLSVRYVKDIS